MTLPSKYYLTTPIYYVNGLPHLGTAYTTIAGDAVARFWRARGVDTFFLTGLDEHGQKVQEEAAKHGLDPQKWTDSVAPQFKEVWRALNISYDHFIRTTDSEHIKAVQHFLTQLLDKDAIYSGTYEGYYCVPEETFFTEEQVNDAAATIPTIPDGEANAKVSGIELKAGEVACPDCGRPLQPVKEDNWFFRLSDYGDKLLKFYDDNPEFICPTTRRNEVVSFVKSGLKDISISRTTFDWGIELPFAYGGSSSDGGVKHVAYVWIDALINYLTAVGYGSEDTQDKERFAHYWPADIHFVGKDIIRFHCVIWPAMLMALGIAPPHKVFAHGFLLTKGEKMGKSRGNALSPLEIAEMFSVDAYRYYFLSDVEFGADGSISIERMEQVYNADLANVWGNLVSRITSMSLKYLPDSKVPDLWDKTLVYFEGELGNPLRDLSEQTVGNYMAAFEAVDFTKAMQAVQELAGAANKYIEDVAPWSIFKLVEGESVQNNDTQVRQPTNQDKLYYVLYNILETVRICASLFMPVMPETSSQVFRLLGLPAPQQSLSESNLQWGGLPAGSAISTGEPLFMRKNSTLHL